MATQTNKTRQTKGTGDAASEALNELLKSDAPPAEKPRPVKAEVKPLAKDEYEIVVPKAPYKQYAEGEKRETVTKRFFKPKKWKIGASARNARWLHVIDEDRVKETGEALCTINVGLWMGMRDLDPKEAPITCPWCFVRMEKCGLVTKESNDKLIEEYKAAQAAAKKKPATAEAPAAPEPAKAKTTGSRSKSRSTGSRTKAATPA